MDSWACSEDRSDRRRLRKNIVKECPRTLTLYSTHSRGTQRWISVWDEKLTEQNTHIKNEKKVEGDVSENIKQHGFINF